MIGMCLKSMRGIGMGRSCFFVFWAFMVSFGGGGGSEDSEWELGEVIIVSISGSSPIELGKELVFGLGLESEKFEWESSEERGVGR